MPIYEFECETCGSRFDRLQKLSDPDPTDCPTCATPKIRRRVTAPSFRLAGSGWYETDFKKDGDKKRNLVGKDDAAPKSADAGKSDAAPAKPDAPKSDAPKSDAKKTAPSSATPSSTS